MTPLRVSRFVILKLSKDLGVIKSILARDKVSLNLIVKGSTVCASLMGTDLLA
jgi:hypothetical protein